MFVAFSLLVSKTNQRPWHQVGFILEIGELIFVHTISNLFKPFAFIRSKLRHRVNKTV